MFDTILQRGMAANEVSAASLRTLTNQTSDAMDVAKWVTTKRSAPSPKEPEGATSRITAGEMCLDVGYQVCR